MIVGLPILLFAGVFIALISMGVRNRSYPLLTEPRCAKCNYDLRGFAGTVPTRCSECGADLTVRHAVVWGTYQPNKKRIWFAVFVGLIPALLVPILLIGVKSTVIAPGSPGFLARSNAAVIASLATTANTPWDWQELERRLALGKLSNAEVGQAIDSLITFLKSQPSTQPLNWADQFLSKADSAGMIPDEQYLRLARAFYKPSTVSVATRIRSGGRLPVGVQGGGAWQLPGMEFVYALRQVTVNGLDAPLIVSSNRDYNHKNDPDYLSGNGNTWNIDGVTRLNLPPGDYSLTFTIDKAVLLDKTAPQVVDNLPGQASRWPKSRAAWTETITAPIKVVPVDQSPIAIVTDPTLDPRITGAAHVSAIRVIRKGTGQRVTAELSIDGAKVPCSFDVILRIAGKEYPAGGQVAYPTGSSSTEPSCDLESLDPAVQTADVLLRPNPKRAEGQPGIDRVWGGNVDLLNIPLQRYDLPASP